MEPRISLITLGVSDLERSVRFYRDGLGLPRREGPESIAFFETGGTWLSLYPRDALAEDATVSPDGSGFRGFALAHNVESPEVVDRTLDEAVAAGALGLALAEVAPTPCLSSQPTKSSATRQQIMSGKRAMAPSLDQPQLSRGDACARRVKGGRAGW